MARRTVLVIAVLCVVALAFGSHADALRTRRKAASPTIDRVISSLLSTYGEEDNTNSPSAPLANGGSLSGSQNSMMQSAPQSSAPSSPQGSLLTPGSSSLSDNVASSIGSLTGSSAAARAAPEPVQRDATGAPIDPSRKHDPLKDRRQSALVADNTNVLTQRPPRVAKNPLLKGDQSKTGLEKKMEADIKASAEFDQKSIAEDNEKKIQYAKDEQIAKAKDVQNAEADNKYFIERLREKTKNFDKLSMAQQEAEKETLRKEETRNQEIADEAARKVVQQEEQAKARLKREEDTFVKNGDEQNEKMIAEAKAQEKQELDASAARIKRIQDAFDEATREAKKKQDELAAEQTQKDKDAAEKAAENVNKKVQEGREKDAAAAEALKQEQAKKEEEKKRAEKAAEQSDKEIAKKEAEEKKTEQANKAEEDNKVSIRPQAYNPGYNQVIAQSSRLQTNDWKGAISYTFWINVFGIIGNWGSLLHKGGGDYQRNPAFWLYPGRTNLHMRSGVVNNAGGWYDGTNPGCDTEPLQMRTWTHVTFIHQPGAMDVYFCYLNGSIRHVCHANIAGPAYNGGPLYSADPWYSAPQATLSDVRVYNRALSQDDIMNICKKKTGTGA